MVVFNYTSIKRREKKVYSFFNSTISQQGIGMNWIKTCAVCLALFNTIGVLFCLFTGKIWYNPIHFAEGTAAGYFYLVFIGGPIGLGSFLNVCKIQNYRAVDYLKLYFEPKRPLNQFGRIVKVEGFSVKTSVERI